MYEIKIKLNSKPTESLNIYNENEVITQTTEDPKTLDEETIKEKSLTLTILGELQFGGKVTKNLNDNYMLSIKDIAEYTKNSNYTIATLGTNILRTDKVDENITSKYVVSKPVINAFEALGIDGLNIATDHMLDYGDDVFNITKGVLEENDIDILGLENSVIYVENDGIKIAIIGVLNEVIGTETDYTKAGIFMYNLNKLENVIKDAKNKVNTVILMTHLGYENEHTVTKVMSWFYKKLIDMGADAVIGTHSLGVYNVEIYKNKPIIYSLGYFISDTSYETGKKSGILTFTFNETGKIKKMEMVPTYTKDKTKVMPYIDIDKENSLTFMQMFCSDIVNRQITDEKVIINLN